MKERRILSRKLIVFRHPGYSDRGLNDRFLKILGFDHENGGIHHQTALTICGIVTGNVWNGHFTATRHGSKLEAGADDILLGSEYFFHNPSYADSDEPYPLVASFNNWVFPHDNLPPSFTSVPPNLTLRTARAIVPPSNLSQAIQDRDVTCRLSDYGDILESGHLCPSNAEDWFRRNEMNRYCRNPSLPVTNVTADVNNALALRKDIHHAMDDQLFAIVPKRSAWTIHFFQPTVTLGPKYHDRSMQPLSPEIAPEFLLTRLAWTVFPLISTWLEAGPQRKVEILVGNDEKAQMWKSGQEIRLAHPQAKKGSQSPTKRSRETGRDEGQRKRICYGHADEDEDDDYLHPDAVARQIYLWRSDRELLTLTSMSTVQPTMPDFDTWSPISSFSSVSDEGCSDKEYGQCSVQATELDLTNGDHPLNQSPAAAKTGSETGVLMSSDESLPSSSRCWTTDEARSISSTEIQILKDKWLQSQRPMEYGQRESLVEKEKG